jgi:hypothetical protein
LPEQIRSETAEGHRRRKVAERLEALRRPRPRNFLLVDLLKYFPDGGLNDLLGHSLVTQFLFQSARTHLVVENPCPGPL